MTPLSPEGNPWQDYRWADLAAGIILGLPVFFYWKLAEWTSRRAGFDLAHLPDDAIIFAFHKDMHALAINSITALKHRLPLPFSALELRFSRLIGPEELRPMSKAKILALLQGLIEGT